MYYKSATLIAETLTNAVCNLAGRGNILRKIVREIAAVVRLLCSDERFFVHGAMPLVGLGKVDKEMLDALRTGLEMLFQSEYL